MAKSNAQTHKTKTDLVRAFSYVENGGLNLVLKLAKPLTCMTVVLKNMDYLCY